MQLNIIRPPKNTVSNKYGFWKNIGMMVLGTTISLILTISAAQLLSMHQRAKDRRLSAMMVMSNIESFSRTLELRAERMAPSDTVAAWLLNTPVEELELLPEEELQDVINHAFNLATLNHDHSAENVFSNNIETWKNMGNVHFIDNVGSCFSAINGVEEQFNDWVKGVDEAMRDVHNNPGNYEGATTPVKMMHSDRIRAALAAIHNRRCWLRYAAASLRHFNRTNMMSIDITEQEVMDYTDEREENDYDPGPPPDSFNYYTGAYTLDSLTTMSAYTARIEELKAGKK